MKPFRFIIAVERHTELMLVDLKRIVLKSPNSCDFQPTGDCNSFIRPDAATAHSRTRDTKSLKS